MTEPKNINIHRSNKNFFLLVLLAIGIWYLGVKAIKAPYLLIQIAGYLNLILSATISIIVIKNLFSFKPVITINDKGVYDRRIMKEAIPHGEIENMELVMLGKQNHLQLTLNGNVSSKNFKNFYKITAKRQLETTPKTININLEMCMVDYGKLLNVVNKKHH